MGLMLSAGSGRLRLTQMARASSGFGYSTVEL